MPIPRARHRFWRLASASQFYDAFIAILAAVGAAVASARLLVDGWHIGGKLALSSAFLMGALSIVRAVLAYWHQGLRESPYDLRGCLMTLHGLLVAGEDPSVEKRVGLRMTLHVAVDDRRLQQVLDYVGDQRGGRTAGRFFAMQSGIAGRAYRIREACWARRNRSDYEGYVRELVERWNYVEPDARRLDSSSMAWMAVPLMNPGGWIDGLLYLDTKDGDFFTRRRQALILQAASGIARYITERYPARRLHRSEV